MASLGHIWTPDDQTIVQTQIHTQKSLLTFVPAGWKDCENWDADDRYCLDDEGGDSWYSFYPDGFNYGNFPYNYRDERHRSSANTSLTRYASLLGEHELKVGIQAELMSMINSYGRLGDGYQLWAYTDTPTNLDSYVPVYLYDFDHDNNLELSGTLLSWYVQDVYRPIDRLTLRPGLRFDKSSYNDKAGEKVFEDLTVAPRLGAAFDLTGDGKTSLHAYYGRFYDTGMLQLGSILSADQFGLSVYGWDAAAEDWGTEPLASVSGETIKGDDLNSPYSDEFNVGVTRDVGGGWGLGTSFIYEESHRFFEDDEINLIWNADGTDVIDSRDGTGTSRSRLRTPDEMYLQYTAVEFVADKQFTDKWGMLASYTWSHTYGVESNDPATGLFDIPQQYVNEQAVTSADIPHSVKVYGSYRDPDRFELTDKTGLGWLVGWRFDIRSGAPYRRHYYNAYDRAWTNLGDDREGDLRLPTESYTNLKTGLTLSRPNSTWDLLLECYNVFNTRVPLTVNTAYDDPAGDGVYLDEEGDMVFGSVLTRVNPRKFKLALRGEF